MHKPARDPPVRAFCVRAGQGSIPGKNEQPERSARHILNHVETGGNADPWPVTPGLPIRIGEYPEPYESARETAEQATPALHMIDHIRNFARR